jgi:uncharacterized protein YacL
VRIVIRMVFALLGALAALQIARYTGLSTDFSSFSTWAKWVAVTIGGALAGWIFAILISGFTVSALRRVEAAALSRPAGELVVGGVGLLLGLGVATFATFAIGALPFVGNYLLLPLFLVLGYLFAVVGARNHVAILRLVHLDDGRASTNPPRPERELRRTPKDPPPERGLLVDTSAIIDGRIGDLVATGFLDRELVIPVFVLLELQRVADSADPLRRARGRRGLEVVHELRRGDFPLSTPELDYDDLPDVDAKLVRLAHERSLPVLTTDYNLNRVAKIQGVQVLNINELANALKPAVLPGESLRVKVLREGKEADQGVGYLDDGTMIVIEGARRLVGDTVDVEVTSVLQSPSGKMIFTKVA